ncbi:MAG: hypothetical protein ACYDEV_18240 [Acidiferrobacter sp.]
MNSEALVREHGAVGIAGKKPFQALLVAPARKDAKTVGHRAIVPNAPGQKQELER